jgi:hypothetical protein
VELHRSILLPAALDRLLRPVISRVGDSELSRLDLVELAFENFLAATLPSESFLRSGLLSENPGRRPSGEAA